MHEKQLIRLAREAETKWIKKQKRRKGKKFTLDDQVKRVDFYKTKSWYKLRYRVLDHYGRVCMKCGANGRKACIQVDHIKPRSKFPHLDSVFSNLQVLCKDCNKLKSDWDYTDYRPAHRIPIVRKRTEPASAPDKTMVRTVIRRRQGEGIVRVELDKK